MSNYLQKADKLDLIVLGGFEKNLLRPLGLDTTNPEPMRTWANEAIVRCKFANVTQGYDSELELHKIWYLVFDTLNTNAYTKCQ